MFRAELLFRIVLPVGFFLLQQYLAPLPPQPKGFCKPKFKALEAVYRKNYEAGIEKGSAFAVYHQGELVCDMWGGWADKDEDLPWSQETMTHFFSLSKGVSAIAIALLCDRGFCNYNTMVSEYWPEFGQNGKDNVTLGMLLSHQAGIAALDETITSKMMKEDTDKVGRIIAAQKPHWSPGSAVGYHSLTYGLIVDQLVPRIDPKKRTTDQFIKEEIAEAYDIDYHVGLPRSLQWRAARLTPHGFFKNIYEFFYHLVSWKLFVRVKVFKETLVDRALNNPKIDESKLNHPDFRASPEGGYNCYGTARGLARLFSLVASAKYHDEEALLSDEAVKLLQTSLHNGTDKIHGMYGNYGPGILVDQFGKNNHPLFYFPGKGCQMEMGSSSLEVSFAYINNHPCAYIDTTADTRLRSLFRELRIAVDA